MWRRFSFAAWGGLFLSCFHLCRGDVCVVLALLERMFVWFWHCWRSLWNCGGLHDSSLLFFEPISCSSLSMTSLSYSSLSYVVFWAILLLSYMALLSYTSLSYMALLSFSSMSYVVFWAIPLLNTWNHLWATGLFWATLLWAAWLLWATLVWATCTKGAWMDKLQCGKQTFNCKTQ